MLLTPSEPEQRQVLYLFRPMRYGEAQVKGKKGKGEKGCGKLKDNREEGYVHRP